MYKNTRTKLRCLGLEVRKANDQSGTIYLEKVLERKLFATVNVHYCVSAIREKFLVIDFDCPFYIEEFLQFIQEKTWDKLRYDPISDTHISVIGEVISEYRSTFEQDTDIAEINILLKDCTLVLKKIYSYSIEKEIGNLLNALLAHYVHFTKNLPEAPNEIYIPVFEESDSVLTGTAIAQPAATYFKYWGIYYADNWKEGIYELNSLTFLQEAIELVQEY